MSNLFSGLEFLVLNLDDNLSVNTTQKKTIECCIVEHGGVKVQNFLPTTTHIIASKLDIRAQNLLKTMDVNIYSPKWVYDCVKYNKFMTISPLYLIYINKETKKTFSKTIDPYNDNYFEDVTKDNLIEILASIKDFKEKDDFNLALEELRKEYKDVNWIN